MESAAVWTSDNRPPDPQRPEPVHKTSADPHSTRRCSAARLMRPNAASGDSRRKTPVRCASARDWVPGRIVSAAILQLGNGWRIGTFVGHIVMWRSTLGSLHPWCRCSLSPLSPGLPVLLFWCNSQLCANFASHTNAPGVTGPVKPLSQIKLSKSAVFSETESRFEIYKHSLVLVAQSRTSFSVTGTELQLWGKEISQIIAVIRHKLKEWFSRITTADRKWSCGHPGSRQWTTRREIEFWFLLVSHRFN